MNEGVEKHTTTPQTIRAGRAAQGPFRRWTFRTAAILVSLVLLAGIELGFRLAGVGYDPSFIVPGELDGKPTYRENERFSWRFFPPAIARTPMRRPAALDVIARRSGIPARSSAFKTLVYRVSYGMVKPTRSN